MVPLKRRQGDSFVLLDDAFNVIDEHPKNGVQAIWAQLQVSTVQHTGTNFVAKLLTDAGWTVRATHWTAQNVLDKGFVISPIRDPWKTYVTWVSRNRNDSFFGQWQLFNQAYLTNPDLYILPIDTADRCDYLMHLSERLKVQLKTDWKPVESRPHKTVKPTDLSNVYDLPVVKKFYR